MSTNPPPSLYTRLDEQTKRAAEAWFTKMAPQLEEGGKQFVKEQGYDPAQEGIYFEIVHPILMWRFYYHIATIFLLAADGWQEVVVQTGIDHGIEVEEEKEEETYYVKKFYQDESKESEIIEEGLTKDEAQAVCGDPSSRGGDPAAGDAWFLGYYKED